MQQKEEEKDRPLGGGGKGGKSGKRGKGGKGVADPRDDPDYRR